MISPSETTVMFWCLKYDILFASFVLFSLLLATRVDTCSVVTFISSFIYLVNHKRFLRTRYAFSTGYEAAALFSDTEWCSYYFQIQKWCLAFSP